MNLVLEKESKLPWDDNSPLEQAMKNLSDLKEMLLYWMMKFGIAPDCPELETAMEELITDRVILDD